MIPAIICAHEHPRPSSAKIGGKPRAKLCTAETRLCVRNHAYDAISCTIVHSNFLNSRRGPKWWRGLEKLRWGSRLHRCRPAGGSMKVSLSVLDQPRVRVRAARPTSEVVEHGLLGLLAELEYRSCVGCRALARLGQPLRLRPHDTPNLCLELVSHDTLGSGAEIAGNSASHARFRRRLRLFSSIDARDTPDDSPERQLALSIREK